MDIFGFYIIQGFHKEHKQRCREQQMFLDMKVQIFLLALVTSLALV